MENMGYNLASQCQLVIFFCILKIFLVKFLLDKILKCFFSKEKMKLSNKRVTPRVNTNSS